MIKLDQTNQFKPPEEWLEIQTIEAHTGGEPLRIITNGYPELKGKTLLEKREDAYRNHDNIRTAIMWEPRGHADMYGAIIVEPDTPGADFGVIFIHNEGYSTGCGHAVIALTKVFVETNLISKAGPEIEVKIDVPSGFIRSYAKIENEEVVSVRFQNVPSFVQSLNAELDVPSLGNIKYDLAFGGAFYAFPNIQGTGLSSNTLQEKLLNEAGVAAISGTSFGANGEGYLRFSYANSTENIRKAMSRIRKLLCK